MLTAITEKGKEYTVVFNEDGKSGSLNEQDFNWDIAQIGEREFHVIHKNKSYSLEILEVDRKEKSVQIIVNGKPHKFSIRDRFDELLSKLGMDLGSNEAELEVRAPMPGMVLDVMVKVGDEVSEGQPLLILEAMKMENVLKASSAASISSILIQKGKAVEKNEVLIEFSAS